MPCDLRLGQDDEGALPWPHGNPHLDVAMAEAHDGLAALIGDGRGRHLACPGPQRSARGVAIRQATTEGPRNTVGGADGGDGPPPASPAEVSAARAYVQRIPDAVQQAYAQEYLAWALAGRPEGRQPLLGSYGLSLEAGEHLAATIERLLGRTRSRPRRRRR
jgi:hypothetical protein